MVKTAERSNDHKVSRKKSEPKGYITLSCSCGWPGPKSPIQDKFGDAVESRHLVMVEQESYE
jgi:hypothetical protein